MRFQIKAYGSSVHVNIDNRVFLELEPKAADEFANALRQSARRAEECLLAEKIINDGAILARAGSPILLSVRFRDDIVKEAAWNSDLRRYMPGGVPSREKFGSPTIVNRSKGATDEPK